jgi:hypothetical protein
LLEDLRDVLFLIQLNLELVVSAEGTYQFHEYQTLIGVQSQIVIILARVAPFGDDEVGDTFYFVDVEPLHELDALCLNARKDQKVAVVSAGKDLKAIIDRLHLLDLDVRLVHRILREDHAINEYDGPI